MFVVLPLLIAVGCGPQVGGRIPIEAGRSAPKFYVTKFDRSAMALAPGDRRIPSSEFVVSNYNATGAMVSTMFGPLGAIVYATASQKSLAPEVESQLASPAIDLQAMMTRSLQARVKPGSIANDRGDGRNLIQLEAVCLVIGGENGEARLMSIVTASFYSDSGSLVWQNAYRKESTALPFLGSAGWLANGNQNLIAFLERSFAETADDIIRATQAA